MKITTLSRMALAAGCALALSATSLVNAAAVDSKGRALYAPGEVLLKFKEGVNAQTKNAFHQNYHTKVLRTYRQANLSHIKLPKGINVENAINLFGALDNIAYVEPNYIRYPEAIPNDARFSELYGLNNTGQTGGTNDADIDAVEAWDITTGDPSVVVAVLDTGAALNHPDLVDNLWVNPGEIAGNGIDDDGNGFVDDINGWDFARNDNDPSPFSEECSPHGTHTAGTVGATGNNGIGVTGVSQNVQLMILNIFTSNFLTPCGAFDSDTIAAIEYYDMMGVKISNNSYGGPSASQAVFNAIQGSESIFVAAAGNNGTNNDTSPSFPASYDLDNVISVAATDHDDAMASFSNFGMVSVDVAAPGVSVLSTVPYTSDNSLTVSGTTYQGNWIEFAALGTASAPLVDGGLCDAPGAYAGMVVMCERGVISFFDKVMNVENSGGLAAVIYNNVPGNFNGTLGAGNSSAIPAISLSQADGQLIVATELGNIGDVISTFDANTPGYAHFDGTSMSSPHVAGMVALMHAANPSLTMLESRYHVLDTVDALGLPIATGGRVNANSAVQGAMSVADVTIAFTPLGPTDVSPGSTISYEASVTNNTGSALSASARVYARLQDGNEISVVGPFNINVNAGQTLSVTRSVRVPGNFATGQSVDLIGQVTTANSFDEDLDTYNIVP